MDLDSKVLEVCSNLDLCLGYTALGIAMALPEGGKLYALDVEEAYANVGMPNNCPDHTHSGLEPACLAFIMSTIFWM